ncbi:transmembrane protein 164-like [Ylistrum balloti]|uniref:transmembrane protein 164-like n=1 Tax=Ylistrum balloti TaxID=509963 RepID=UPI002905A4B5|nr:transmembrane protein 164-like [Ylistrum balloti]
MLTTEPTMTPVAQKGMFDWAYNGVDFDLAGNGGEECRNFIVLFQRILESIFACVVAGFMIYPSLLRLTLPKKVTPIDKTDRCGKRVLLVVMCLTFGIELGFKLATGQMIYTLNPCHIVTIIQIYCLAAPPTRSLTVIFRLHLHLLTGAPIALLFPVTNTRLLPFEVQTYYIQHTLMLVVPIYLLMIGGVYTAEPLRDLNWSFIATGLQYIYHFIPLQLLAYVSLVNLNNMMCPAYTDPFYGQWYHLWSMLHQAAMIPLFGKFCVWIVIRLGFTHQLNIEEQLIFKGNTTKVNGSIQKQYSHIEDTSSLSIDGQENVTSKQTLSGENGRVSCDVHVRRSNNGHVKST